MSEGITSRPRPSAIGDHLKRIIHEQWGAVPCGGCASDVAALNAMTADQVRAAIPSLAARMARRWAQLPKWWQRIAARTAAGNPLTLTLLKKIVASAIEEAIERNSRQSPATPAWRFQ